MKLIVFILILFFSSCGEAGVLSQGQSASVSNTTAKLELIAGFVGLEAIQNSNINVLNISDPAHITVIASTSSDEKGYFSFEMNKEATEKILIVASGGNYVDPFSYKTVLFNNYELKAIYKVKNLGENNLVYLTPFSTLFVSLVDCLANNTSMTSDPYYYVRAIFNDVFQIDIENTADLNLNPEADWASSTNALLSLYNLAFSKMASDLKRGSGSDIVNVFADELLNSCSLIIDTNQNSKLYSFTDESFRQDYLDSLVSLNNQNDLSELTGSIDLNKVAEQIRNKNNLIFGYKIYE